MPGTLLSKIAGILYDPKDTNIGDPFEPASLNSKTTWRNVDWLLGNSGSSSRLPSCFMAEDFHQHLEDKITSIMERTAEAGPAECMSHFGSTFDEIAALSTRDIMVIVWSVPNKQCASDPLPVWLIKEVIDVLAPFITSLFSTSLRTGEFPLSWKHVSVLPRLKHPDSDPKEMANYRPGSNLPFLSKVLETTANIQLVPYLAVNGLMLQNQSAYTCRREH